MSTVRVDFSGPGLAVIQGSRWTQTFTITGETSGSPIDLTAATGAICQVRADTVDSGAPVLAAVTPVLGGTDGTITVSLTPTETRALPAGVLHYEIYCVLATGETVIIYGQLEILGEYAR